MKAAVLMPQPRDVIAGCVVNRLLGRGSVGHVFLGEHSALQIPVAIKVLTQTSFGDDEEAPHRFLREARIAALISHPNIVSVKDAGFDTNAGLFYITMEYVDGPALWTLIQQHSVSPDESLLIMRDLASALVEMANHGVVHRDVKPPNILLTKQGRAKLADLGIAKYLTEGKGTVSMAGLAIGTPAYMSPQHIAEPAQVDPRDDIYSLGATLYECLTGVPPFAGDTPLEVLNKVMNDLPIHPGQLKGNLPQSLVAVCQKMMAREREDRYATAKDLLEDLNLINHRNFQSGQGLVATEFVRSGH